MIRLGLRGWLGQRISCLLLSGILVLFFCPAQGMAGGKIKKTEADAMEMNIAEAIAVALRSNRDVKRAYITRVLDKFSLRVAEAEFDPDFNLTSGPSASGSRTKTEGEQGSADSISYRHSSGINMDKNFEYGGRMRFSWNRTDNLGNTSSGKETYSGSNTWTASFTQPLLKGFGKEVATYSLVSARLAEQENFLALRDNIAAVVNSTISAFRSYAQAIRQVEISKASVARSRANLETNKLLIAMGRLAANELIQNESDLANQELSYENTLNSLDSYRIALLKVLNLDRDTRIKVIEETDFSPVHPDMETCLEIAFQNRLDYLSARHAVRMAEIGLTVAENNMQWQLDFTGDYTLTDTNNRDAANTDDGTWSAGLALSVPLYGTSRLSLEQALLSARATLTRARLSMADTEQDIRLGLKDAVREVETRLKQVGMAVRARQLSEQQLAVEKEKLAVGRTTNFQLVSYQNDLKASLESELSAKVDYLNALTSLDNFLATTTDTWKVDYNKENDQWPGK